MIGNIILTELPESITIDNREYKIDTDFKTGMLFEIMMQDEELSENEKIDEALYLYFDDNIPGNTAKAIKAIQDFYCCGKSSEAKSQKVSESTSEFNAIYSFEYDADYIYAAFMHDYNIDLYDIKNLHWWKFRALFKGLSKDNKFVEIMGYRSEDISKIKDKEQREFYKKMKKIYKLPSKKDITEAEKIKQINEALMKGESIDKFI